MNNLIDDLFLEQPNLPMTQDDVVEMINEAIEMKNWSEKDLVSGREIDIFPEWESFIQDIAWQYRWAGWEVFQMIHGDRKYLLFTNPRVRMFNGRRQ